MVTSTTEMPSKCFCLKVRIHSCSKTVVRLHALLFVIVLSTRRWCSMGGWRATVLRNAVERYQAVGKGDLASELLAAGGADSDGGVDSDGGAEQDFVLLELASA